MLVKSKTKGIALDASTDKLALTANELLAVGTTKATVHSDTELDLSGGGSGKATLQSGQTKVH